MLNQPATSQSYLRSEEKQWYGSEDISELVVLAPRPCNNNFYVVSDISDVSVSVPTYYCRKGKRNWCGQEWFAYDNDEGKGQPLFEAYTFRNLKGMLV